MVRRRRRGGGGEEELGEGRRRRRRRRGGGVGGGRRRRRRRRGGGGELEEEGRRRRREMRKDWERLRREGGWQIGCPGAKGGGGTAGGGCFAGSSLRVPLALLFLLGSSMRPGWLSRFDRSERTLSTSHCSLGLSWYSSAMGSPPSSSSPSSRTNVFASCRAAASSSLSGSWLPPGISDFCILAARQAGVSWARGGEGRGEGTERVMGGGGQWSGEQGGGGGE